MLISKIGSNSSSESKPDSVLLGLTLLLLSFYGKFIMFDLYLVLILLISLSKKCCVNYVTCFNNHL